MPSVGSVCLKGAGFTLLQVCFRGSHGVYSSAGDLTGLPGTGGVQLVTVVVCAAVDTGEEIVNGEM